jgi:hypothetical protein
MEILTLIFFNLPGYTFILNNTGNKEQEDKKLLLTHCASLPRRSRALADES